METQFSDTHPERERVQISKIDEVAENRTPANLLAQYNNQKEEREQIEFIRKLSLSERLAIVFEMSGNAIEAVKAEILQEYPGESEEERKLIFVERYYGKEWADRVRPHLAKRQQM
jgi:hypothetical protein